MELSTQQHAAALDYASLSAQIRRNRTEAKQEERVARLQELAGEHKALAAKAKNLRGEIESHQKEARAAAAQAADGRSKAESMEAKLNAGVGLTSRDLVALQADIESVRTAVGQAEDRELQALDSAESAESQLQKLRSRAEAIAAEGKAEGQRRQEEAARLDGEHAQLVEQTTAKLAELPAEAASIIRSSGIGVLAAGACGACGAALSGVQADAVRNAARTWAFQCEDCEGLIVQA